MATLDNVAILSAADPPDLTTPSTSLGVRLRRSNQDVADGVVDGRRWPRSLDLRIELPRLPAEMYSARCDVHRVPQTDSVIAEPALALTGLDDGLDRAGETVECAPRKAGPPVIHSGWVDLPPLANWETDGGRVFISRTASCPA